MKNKSAQIRLTRIVNTGNRWVDPSNLGPLSITNETLTSNGFGAINGFAGMPGAPAGAIKADLNFSVTPNGQVSLDSGNSSITGFPSFGIYSYGTGANGQPQVKSLVEAKEKDPSYLTKPAGPIPKQ